MASKPRLDKSLTNMQALQQSNKGLQRQMSQLRSDLDTERTNIKRLQREKMAEIHSICEQEQRKAAIAMNDLRSKLHHEKLREIENQKEVLSKKHDSELLKVVKLKDSEIQQLQNELKKISRDSLPLGKEGSRSERRNQYEADKTKWLQEISDLQQIKTELEKTLSSVSETQQQTSEELRQIKDRHRSEMSKLEDDANQKITKLVDELRSKDQLIGQLKEDQTGSKMESSDDPHGLTTQNSTMQSSSDDFGCSPERQDLLDRIGMLESKMVDAKIHIRKLEENNTALVGDKENLLKRIKEMERRHKPLQDKNKRFLEKNMELTTINRNLEDKIQKLTEETKKLKQQIEQTKKRAHQLKQQQSADKHHLMSVGGLMEDVEELRQANNEQNKTINALRQACVEKDRRLDILQHRHRKHKVTRAQQKAAGIRETSYGFDDDNRSIDSDMSTCSISFDAHTDDEGQWDEFAKEEFEINYHRLAREHVELERSYALLQALVNGKMDPERDNKMRSQLQSDLVLAQSKVKDLEIILQDKGQDTSWVEDKSKLNAANKVLLSKISSLEDAELRLRHELMESQEQNEVLEFRSLELEEKNDKLVEELKSSSHMVPPGVYTNEGVLQLTMIEAGRVDVRIGDLKDKLHSLKYSRDHELSCDEKNTLMQTQCVFEAADKKLKGLLLEEASLKERLSSSEKEKNDLLSAATGVSSDIVLEFEETRNKLLESEKRASELESEIEVLKKSEAVHKYTDDFKTKTETRYKNEVTELKRRLDSTLRGQSYESEFVNEKMEELKKSEQTVCDLENTVQQLTEKMDRLQRENGDLTEQLNNHQEEQSLAESDRHTITLVQSLQAQVHEHEKSECELMEKNAQLESEVTSLQKRIEEFEENELDLMEKNYTLEEQLERMNENVSTLKSENEKIHNTSTEKIDKLRRHSLSLEKSEEEIIDKNAKLETDMLALREKLKLREEELEHYKSVEEENLERMSKIDELEKLVDNLQTEVSSLRTQAENVTDVESEGGDSNASEVALLKQQVDHLLVSELTLKERAQDLETAEKILKEKYNDLVKKSEETEAELRQNLAGLHGIEHELKESLAEKEMIEQALEEQVKNLEMTVAKTQEQKTKLEESESKLCEKLESYKPLEKDLAQVENMRLMLTALEATKEQLQKRIDDLDDEKQRDLSVLQEKIDVAENENKDLRDQIRKGGEREDILTSQVECLEQKVNFLNSINTELTEEHPEATVGCLKRQISDFGHETDKLEQTLDDKTLKNEFLQEEIASLRENEYKLSETIQELEHEERELRSKVKFYESGSTDESQLLALREHIVEMETADLILIEKLKECEVTEKEQTKKIDALEKEIELLKLAQSDASVSSELLALKEQLSGLEKNEEKLITRIYELEQSEQELSDRLCHSDEDELQMSQSSVRLQELELSDLSLRESLRETENDKKEQGKTFESLERSLREQCSELEGERDLLKQELTEKREGTEKEKKYLSDKVDILMDSEAKLMDRIGHLESVEIQLRSELDSSRKAQEKSLQDEMQMTSMAELQLTNARLTEEIEELKQKLGDGSKNLENEEAVTVCNGCVELEQLKEKVGILIDTEHKLMDRLEQIENVEQHQRVVIQQYKDDEKDKNDEIDTCKKQLESLEQETVEYCSRISVLEKSEEELMEKCSKLENSEKLLKENIASQAKVMEDLGDRLSRSQPNSRTCSTSSLTDYIPDIKISHEDGDMLESVADSGPASNELIRKVSAYVSKVQDHKKQIADLQAKLDEYEASESENVQQQMASMNKEREQFEQTHQELVDKIKYLEGNVEDLQSQLDEAQKSGSDMEHRFIEQKEDVVVTDLHVNSSSAVEHEDKCCETDSGILSELSELELKTHGLEETLRSVRIQKADCEKEICDLQEKFDTSRTELSDYVVKNAKLEKTVCDLQESLSESNSKVEFADNAIEALEEKISQKDNMLKMKDDTISTLEVQIQDNSSAAASNISLAEVEDEKLQLLQKLENFEKDEIEYKKKISGLRAQVDLFESELAERNTFTPNVAKMAELTQKVKEFENKENAFKDNMEELENEMVGCKIRNSKLQKQVDDYKMRIEELESQFEELDSELGSEVDEVKMQELKMETSMTLASSNELSDTAADLQSKVDQLTSELTTKQTQLDELNVSLAELKDLQSQLISKSTELEDIRQKLQASNNLVTELKSDIEGRSSQIELLNSQLSAKTNVPSDSYITTTPIESKSSVEMSNLPASQHSMNASENEKSDTFGDPATLTHAQLVQKVRESSNMEVLNEKKASELENHLTCFREAIVMLVQFMESEGHDMADFRKASYGFDENLDYDGLQEIVKSEANLKEKVKHLERTDDANKTALKRTEKEYQDYIAELEVELGQLQKKSRFQLQDGDTGTDKDAAAKIDELQDRVIELETSKKRLNSQLRSATETEQDLRDRLEEAEKSNSGVPDYNTEALRELEQLHREKVEELLTRIQELEYSEEALQEKVDELKEYDYESLVEQIGNLERTERALQRKIEILQAEEENTITEAMLDRPEDILREQIREMGKMDKHLRHQISDLEHDREELHEIARHDKSTIHDLNVRIRELTLAEKILKEQVNRFELTEESLYNQVDSLQDRLQDLEEQMNEISASERSLQSQLKDYKFTEDSNKRRTNAMETDIEELRSSELNLKKRQNELEKERQMLKQRIDTMHVRLSELDQQEVQLKKKIRNLETAEVTLRSQISKMTAAEGVTKQRISDLEVSNDRQSKRSFSLEDEKSRLRNELSDSEMKRAELEKQVARLLDKEKSYKKQIQQLENSEFDLQKKIQDLQFGQYDMLNRSQEIERSEVRLQEKIADLERNEHKLKLRIQELDASAFMADNKALSQTELENENRLLHNQVREVTSKVTYFEHRSKGLQERLARYEYCNRDDMALVPRVELSELRAQVELLKEHEDSIQQLERSEVNLKDTINKLRQGKNVCGHEQEILDLKNQLTKHNILIREKENLTRTLECLKKEKTTLQSNYDQLKGQFQELRKQFENGDSKPLMKISAKNAGKNEVHGILKASTSSNNTSASSRTRTSSQNRAIEDFVGLLSMQPIDVAGNKTNDNTAPPGVDEEQLSQVFVKRPEMHVSLFDEGDKIQSPASSESLKNNLSSIQNRRPHYSKNRPSDEGSLWQTVEEHKSENDVSQGESAWSSIENTPPSGRSKKPHHMVRFAAGVKDDETSDSDVDSTSTAPPLPGSAPPSGPQSTPPRAPHHNVNQDGDSSVDDSYYLPSTHQNTDGESADEVSEMQDEEDSPPPLPKSPLPGKSRSQNASLLWGSPEELKVEKKPMRGVGSKIQVPSWLTGEDDDEAMDKETSNLTENIGLSFAVEVGQSTPPVGGTPTSARETPVGRKVPTPLWLNQPDGDMYIHSKAAETERGYKTKITELEKNIKSLETQLKIVRMGNKTTNQPMETGSPAGDVFTLKVKIKEKDHQIEVQEKTMKDLRQEISRLQIKVREKEEKIKTQTGDLDRAGKIMEAKHTLSSVNRDKSPSHQIQLELQRNEFNAQGMTAEHWKSMCEKKERELVAKNNELERTHTELRRWQDEARDAESRRIEHVANTGHMEMENQRLKDIDNKYLKVCKEYDDLKTEHNALVETHRLCESLEGDKKELEETVNRMKSQVEGHEVMEGERNLLEKEVKHLLKEVEKKTKSEENLFRDNIHMKRDIERSTEELSRLERVEKDYKLIKSRYNEMERVMNKAQTSVSPLRSRVVSLSHKCKQRDEVIRQLVDEVKSSSPHSSDAVIQAERLLSVMSSEEYNRPLSPLLPHSPEGAEQSSRSWLKRLKSRFRRSRKTDEMSDASASSYRSLEDLDDVQEDDSRPSSGSSRLRPSHSETGLHHRRVRSEDVLGSSASRSVPQLNNQSFPSENRSRTDRQHSDQPHRRHLVSRIHNPPETDTFRVIADYNPEHFSRSGHQRLELSLKEGEIVTVFGAADTQGYYEGEVNGRIGLVPSNYLQPVHTTVSVESVAERRLRHLQSLEHVDGMPEQFLHMQSVLHQASPRPSQYRPGEHDRPNGNLGEMMQSLASGRHSNQLYNGGCDQAVGMPSPVVYQGQTPGPQRSIPHTSGHLTYGRSPSQVPQPQFSTPNAGQQQSGPQMTTGQNGDSNPDGQMSRTMQQHEGPPEPPSNFRLEKILADRSVLLSWELPEMDELGRSNGSLISGYKIFINGKVRHEVKSAHLRKVLLEKLDLHRPQHFSIQTTARNGHVSNMADFLFDEMIPEPSGDSGTVTESSDVEHADDASSVTSSGVYDRGEKKLFIGVYDYNPMEHSPNAYPAFELPFHAGDLIKTSGPMRADGFYHGEIHGRRGLVPASFMEEVAVSQPPSRRHGSRAHTGGSNASVHRQSSHGSSNQSSVRPRHSKHRHHREKRNHRAKEVRL